MHYIRLVVLGDSQVGKLPFKVMNLMLVKGAHNEHQGQCVGARMGAPSRLWAPIHQVTGLCGPAVHKRRQIRQFVGSPPAAGPGTVELGGRLVRRAAAAETRPWQAVGLNGTESNWTEASRRPEMDFCVSLLGGGREERDKFGAIFNLAIKSKPSCSPLGKKSAYLRVGGR